MGSAVRDLMSVRQAATRLGWSRLRVLRAIWSGRLPARRIDSVYVLRRRDVEQLAARHAGPQPAV